MESGENEQIAIKVKYLESRKIFKDRETKMRAYKLKGSIAQSGQIILTEPIDLPNGEVEVIILQQNHPEKDFSVGATTANGPHSQKIARGKVKSLKELLGTAPPIPPDFDAEQARWEASLVSSPRKN